MEKKWKIEVNKLFEFLQEVFGNPTLKLFFRIYLTLF